MGRPNFQRLAELGQLPDYIKPTVDEALTQVNATKKKAKKAKKIKEAKGKVKEEAKKEKEEGKETKKEKDVFIDDILK